MSRRNDNGLLRKMAFRLYRKKSGDKRLSRTDPVSDKPDRNSLRGHALFVRFLERRGLSDCVHYFPEEMTLGMLRSISPRELMQTYHVQNARDRERIMTVIESCREDHSEEVSARFVQVFCCVCEMVVIVRCSLEQPCIGCYCHMELSSVERGKRNTSVYDQQIRKKKKRSPMHRDKDGRWRAAVPKYPSPSLWFGLLSAEDFIA